MSNSSYNSIENGRWIFGMPITGIQLSDSINEELAIQRVTLVSYEKLKKSRTRFYRISKSTFINDAIFSSNANKVETFALIKFNGNPKLSKLELLGILTDELNIFLSSQLGKRSSIKVSVDVFGSKNREIGTSLFLKNDEKQTTRLQIESISSPFSIVVDSNWKRVNNQRFLFKLLKVISKKDVDETWKGIISRVLILAGQSQNSNNLAYSFLWNMIAIEAILTQNEGGYHKVLKDRMEAFFGWLNYWKNEDFLTKIHKLYNLRCDIVHRGLINKVTVEDLIFADELLLNLLVNIAHHPKQFSSQKVLITYCKKFKAEQFLGIKSKVQPNKLTYIRRKYSNKDIAELRKYYLIT